MCIRVPRHFYIGMPQSSRDLLDIDSLIGQKGGVRMTEIMDANVRKACCLCKQFIFIFDCGITQAFYPAAHSSGASYAQIIYSTGALESVDRDRMIYFLAAFRLCFAL